MKSIIAISLFVLIFSKSVFASLKLNEIYPAPPSGEYEWVELYNDESQIIDISQYQILDLAGNKIKISTQSALPFGFVLATSSSVLNNTGDTISLKNNLGETIEITTYSGTFDSNKTFAKCPNGNGSWFVLNTLTKNSSNETVCQILTPSPILTLIPTDSTDSTDSPTPYTLNPTPFSYDNIYISEVMVNPATGEKEWLEIYNDNDFSVSLNNWYIDDLENTGSSPKIFSLEIKNKSYGILDLSSSIFNNDGDSVRLLDFDKKLKDDFEYLKSEQGKTLGRNSFYSDDFCLQEPSKNSVNNSCIYQKPTLVDVQTPNLVVSLTPTRNILQTKILSTPTSKFTPNNRFVISNNLLSPVEIKSSGQVLGTTNKIIIDSPNNKSLINLLCFLSSFYSFLVIVSILIKTKALNKYALAS